MGANHESRQEATGKTANRENERLIQGQPVPVGEILSTGGAEIGKQIRHSRRIPDQLFGGKISSVDQAIVIEMIDQCREQLEESAACIEWYQNQEAKILKRLNNLEQILKRASADEEE
ncbi:MAG: hypothetical protein ACRC8A_16945 [Microcoleaceae cyanobacterium]